MAGPHWTQCTAPAVTGDNRSSFIQRLSSIRPLGAMLSINDQNWFMASLDLYSVASVWWALWLVRKFTTSRFISKLWIVTFFIYCVRIYPKSLNSLKLHWSLLKPDNREETIFIILLMKNKYFANISLQLSLVKQQPPAINFQSEVKIMTPLTNIQHVQHNKLENTSSPEHQSLWWTLQHIFDFVFY